MPLPGGPANKLGNRYETWWTVSQLVRVVRGEATSIEIEPPGAHFAEFAIRTPDATEYHQAKLQHHSGKWTLPELRSDILPRAVQALAITPNAQFRLRFRK